jgi:lantibiotic modifying enzyme
VAEPRDKSLSRRAALRQGFSSVAHLTGALLGRRWSALAPLTSQGIEIPNYLDAATSATDWIVRSTTTVGSGKSWPVDPAVPTQFATNLYSGAAGIVLFLLEMYAVTYRSEYLDAALAGATHLAGSPLPAEADCGLYTGAAGLAWVLDRVNRAAPSAEVEKAARRFGAGLRHRAREVGAGVEWGPSTDIISGGAGIGLALIALHASEADQGYLDLAERAGRRLMELGIPHAGGLKWPVNPGNPRLMPNFAHGAAGVAYFLATLFLHTRKEEFLEGALKGGRYLQAVANTDDGGCRVFHNELDGANLYYLGWCHGPAGTARLFWQLHGATGEGEWREWAVRCAQSLEVAGVPESRSQGFWNNHGLCCGTAGVGAFFLSLYQATLEKRYWDMAKRSARVVLDAATRDTAGLRWLHAEHRVQPDQLVAQTGYMQGASGIGSFLLAMHLHEQGKRRVHPLPDDPFGRASR